MSHAMIDLSAATDAEIFDEAERRRAAKIADAIAARSTARAEGHAWIKVAECGFPVRTVRAAARRGELAIRRIGRADYLARTDLDKWIAGRAPQAEARPIDETTAKMLAAGRLRVVGGRGR